MRFKHVLVTGGTGYVGSLLVPQLIDLGYQVTAYDTMYFGDASLFRPHAKLKVIQGDIRDAQIVDRCDQRLLVRVGTDVFGARPSTE